MVHQWPKTSGSYWTSAFLTKEASTLNKASHLYKEKTQGKVFDNCNKDRTMTENLLAKCTSQEGKYCPLNMQNLSGCSH